MSSFRDIPPVRIIFHGKTVLVTGGVGLTASAVLLRLLTSFECKRVVTILRGTIAAARLPLSLQMLRSRSADVTKPLIVVEGDCTKSGFDASSSDREVLKTVEIVLHIAADTSFHKPLADKIRINSAMAYMTCEFSVRTPSVTTHLHLSTYYLGYFLAHGATLKEQLVQDCDEVLGPFINTCSKAKYIAENIVDSFAKAGSETRFAVVRLSTVGPAIDFPYPGWGADGKSSPVIPLICAKPWTDQDMHPEAFLNNIPVELVANQIVGLAAATSLEHASELPWSAGRAVPVYHVAASGFCAPFTLLNQMHMKISHPFIPNSVMIKNYGPMLQRDVHFETSRTREMLGDRMMHGEVDMEDVIINVETAMVFFGGFEAYFAAIRRAVEKKANEKKAKAAVWRYCRVGIVGD